MPPSPVNVDQVANPPYRRSWIDALVALVDRLPGPAWAPYALLTFLFVAAGTGLRWLDGTLPVGTFSAPRIAIDVVAIYGLAAIHHAKWVATRSLEAFRPALGELESREGLLRYRLTYVPRRTGIVSIFIGILFAILSLVGGPEAWDITPTTPPGVAAFFIFEALLMMVLLVTFWLFAYHQLGTVVQIHRQATNVTVLERTAHSGFSLLTLSTSISVALPIYIASVCYAIAGEFLVEVSPADVVLMVIVLVTAALLFVVPLYGMHRRLIRHKALALDTAGRSFERTTAELHRRIAAGNFEELGGLNTALSSLTTERDALRGAPTWPWEARTLRGFLSSIGLPLVIWTATTLLGRLLT